ncbi:MAG: hypothetical protein DRI90_02290 [Deltaproteobacteria bacterium]|nr:MAG: hypothetical protein DRI90_02290 [Deltaproteobacteria bacterium]
MKPKYATLKPLLVQHQAALAQQWLEKTVGTYPDGASKFLKGQANQFANPVGHTLATGLTALCGLLIEALDTDDFRAKELCDQLEPIVKIRSIQDFTPSQAVSFVFLFKAVVREQLASELRKAPPSLLIELSSFDARIDQLVLFAFDVFAKYRDRFFEIRVNEAKRRVSGLLRRLKLGLDDLKADPEP